MKTFFALPLILAVSLAVAAPERPSDRRAAQSFFVEYDAAMNRGDLDRVFSFHAPTFHLVDAMGKVKEGEETRQEMARMLAGKSGFRQFTSVRNVQHMNLDLVVWVEKECTWTEGSGEKRMPMQRTTRWAHTLTQTPDGWKLMSCQQLPVDEPWSFNTESGR